MKRRFNKLLVLDLDETLVHVPSSPLPHAPHFRVGTAAAYRRPGLDSFITTCLQWFKVGIWTASSMEHAGDVIFHLGTEPSNFEFIWTHEHCTRGDDPRVSKRYWIKDMNQLLSIGYSAQHIIVVDNTPECWNGHRENLVQVASFNGDVNDSELNRVLSCLEGLGPLADVRKKELTHAQQYQNQGKDRKL